MHVIVLGAGIIGVTTAYYLSHAGHRVTVVDRADEVARYTSHANGGQLSYGFADALGTPAFVRKIPALLAGRDFAIRIRLGTKLLPWSLRFLMQCTPARSQANTLAMLELAQQSSALMDELRLKVELDDAFRRAGKIVLLSSDQQIHEAERGTAAKRIHGIDVVVLSRAEAEAVEPAISSYTGPIKAAVYAREDAVADARRFCVGLRAHLEREYNARFQMQTPVHALVRRNRAIVGVSAGHSKDDVITSDAVVVCLGAWSDDLLRPLGLSTGIYPVRGYSVTLPAGKCAPSASLTSLTNRFVFSRFDEDMRIAGFTDFDGFNRSDDDKRIDTLVRAARRLAPDFADYEVSNENRWGGFRPMTPSGRPHVGETNYKGLYINTGHGMLGWTLALATGKMIADNVPR